MNNIKIQAAELLKTLPDDCNWEDIQYHIYVREKVEKGIEAINKGEVITQEEAERNVEKWLKSIGQKQH